MSHVAPVEADPLREPRVQRLLIALAIGFGVVAFVMAFGDVVRDFDYAQWLHVLRRLKPHAIQLALLATVVSFLGFIAREMAALRYVGARPPWLSIVLCGLAAPALANVAGFRAFTGAAVRYRIYGAVGLGPGEVMRVVGVVWASLAIGLATVGGGAALLRARDVAALFGWTPNGVAWTGAAALGVVGTLLVFGAPRGLRQGPPLAARDRALIALQALFTAVRLIGAATALWVLLPAGLIPFGSFVPLFMAATALGVLSHVPGGVGVFELVVLWALKRHAPTEAVAAALAGYRVIYYVLPLLLSAVVFAGFELRLALDPAAPRADARLSRAAAKLTPTFAGLFAFGVGMMLLVSAATPSFGSRLSLLSRHVPLWVLETSSLLGAALGVVFLFLTRGLAARRNGAWRIAVAATLASFLFSALKGLAFGEIALLACFLTLLTATRRQFARPTSLFDEPFTWGWFVAVGAILAAALGVFWLAFHNGAHHLSDWRSIGFDAQAPRALRALMGAAVAAGGFGLWQLLRAPSGRVTPADAESARAALAAVGEAAPPEAQMALMGDKAILVSASGRAFLMYGKRGRSWIALYDPIGPREEWRELVERFVRLAAEHGGRANFYQTRPESLPFYLDMGFTATKLGEEAVIDLPGFTLKGGTFYDLRYALKRGERDGLAFEWLTPEAAQARFEELAAVSDSWLDARRAEEKGFSVAAFDAAFLAGQPVGLVSKDGKAVAFASVMAAGREATLGLLRHGELPCPVAMEYLMTKLALSLREAGFARFSLGVAPLAGVTPAPLQTRWGRIAELLWRHGGRFYNFQGLRAFKNKLHPVWEPRYLVSSGAMGPFMALADATALIGATARPREKAAA